jgi:hypothetical protein
VLLLVASAALAQEAPGGASPKSETVEQAMCRFIDGAARGRNLPSAFLTRLIWRESSFRSGVVSHAGAQGVAQFMPGTAAERGLADPFDPEQAIPEAARFLSDLRAQFGNLGLAAAAYNGGPGRVAGWLRGAGELRDETRDYVAFITGRSVDDWAADTRQDSEATRHQQPGPSEPCLVTVALLRRGPATTIAEGPMAPWGIQLAGNFSKSLALASYGRARARYAAVLPEIRPMIIGTRLRARGTRAFYRVRVPQPTRAAAALLCDRIRTLGGACVVLRT